MAHPKWLNKYLQMKPEVSQIYDDLEELRTFCVNYGYSFDERDLYNERSPTYQDFMRKRDGKYVKNRWFQKEDDRNKFKPRDTNGPRGYNNYRSGHNR